MREGSRSCRLTERPHGVRMPLVNPNRSKRLQEGPSAKDQDGELPTRTHC